LTETLFGLALIKLRAAEDLMKRRFGVLVEQFRYVESRRHLFTELQSPVLNTLAGLFICSLLLLALAIYGTGDRSWTGLFIFFIICLYRLIAPASRLITAHGVIAGNLDAFAATESFIADAARSRLPNGSQPFRSLARSVQLEGASLTYEEDRAPAIEAVSLEIRRGEIVALVGASGAGKSTVLTLLMRLRDPTEGRVVVDGRDLRDYDIVQWRRRVALVSQNIVLFNDSVRNNLTFGLADVSDDQIWASLCEASADDFVREMPGALSAVVGDAGLKLSGGQKQRLALARALLARPELLILDEATSQLDSITESSIQSAIESSRGRRSVLIVAHRLSTVRAADRIYVLHKGRVVEHGAHADLSTAGGQYERLFASQNVDVVAAPAK
jgi:subfamily B ATP-binding cassette protein MsbA